MYIVFTFAIHPSSIRCGDHKTAVTVKVLFHHMYWLRNSKGHTTIVRSLLADLWHVKREQYTVQVTQECILGFTVSLVCSWNIHSVIPNGPQDTRMVCQQLHYGMSWFFFITKRYFAFDGFQCLGSSFFSLSVWRNKFTNSVVVESCYHFKFRPMIFSHMLFFFPSQCFSPDHLCIKIKGIWVLLICLC